MVNVFLKFLIILVFLSTSVFSAEVTDIEITGNKRISKQTILVLGDISKDQEFNDNKINNSLKKLYNSNFFSDIDMRLIDGKLSIKVIENPIIEDIEFIGIKSKEFLKKISESIVLKNRMSFTEDQLQKDVTLIKNVLKSNGFYFADVETLKQLNNNEQVIFRYCDKDGNISEKTNPNGAVENIAGICNYGRNVFGMMPHPERAADQELSNTDGSFIFESIISVLEPV